MKLEYRPIIYRLNVLEDEKSFEELTSSTKDIKLYDTIYSQLSELVKLLNPGTTRKEEIDSLVADHIQGTDLKKYGVWVYYPWSKNLVHLLDEDEFIKVRTNRNIYKILPEEVETLGKKIIGIVGLSVGQSIAMTLALER